MQSRFSSKRQKWLGNMASNRVQPRSLAGGQNNGFHQGYLERCAKEGATKMRITIGWIFVAALVSGCGGDVRAKVSIPTSGDAVTGNAAFETYRRAALDVENRAAKYISRTAWTPDQRDFIVEASAGAIRDLSGIEGAHLGKTWNEPFGLRDHTRGWRTVGRALAWRIDRDIKEENFADAAYCLKTAMRMANALSTSDSHDATLGLEIVDESMATAWQYLPVMPEDVLAGVATDIAGLLQQSPAPEVIVAQERAIVLAQAEWVRAKYQERDFKTIANKMGKAVAPALKYLRGLTEQPPHEQQAYFTEFANEIEGDLRLFAERLHSAPYQWQEEDDRKTRPWMRFTRSFGASWRVYATRRAEVRTRLRLFAIDAALLSKFKAMGAVPKDLADFPKSLRSDPYSGNDLVFLSRGVDYKLYSVGSDGIDGGGDREDISLGR